MGLAPGAACAWATERACGRSPQSDGLAVRGRPFIEDGHADPHAPLSPVLAGPLLLARIGRNGPPAPGPRSSRAQSPAGARSRPVGSLVPRLAPGRNQARPAAVPAHSGATSNQRRADP